ncbi:hypothetical protein BDV95DRAFT_250340 [Massariosphaeria phaeospora]|uniref:Uncharacterized protein n=1 Tax=Massariosphaeria phaeospora TaxID=100035 RepID=A0A7C8HYY5_9PLEO|nr:hypothetical protein BDV95DRAFT_250340 [Massariosphaeria phaeospora]
MEACCTGMSQYWVYIWWLPMLGISEAGTGAYFFILELWTPPKSVQRGKSFSISYCSFSLTWFLFQRPSLLFVTRRSFSISLGDDCAVIRCCTRYFMAHSPSVRGHVPSAGPPPFPLLRNGSNPARLYFSLSRLTAYPHEAASVGC